MPGEAVFSDLLRSFGDEETDGGSEWCDALRF